MPTASTRPNNSCGEGNLTARRADQAMAHVMVNALRHGAYRAGIKGLAAKFVVSDQRRP